MWGPSGVVSGPVGGNVDVQEGRWGREYSGGGFEQRNRWKETEREPWETIHDLLESFL